MSSMQQESPSTNKINEVFANKKLTGYDIACNNELSQMVRRDSTDFTSGVVNHERGRQIVCQLIDVALRPRLLINYLQQKRKHEQSAAKQTFQKEPSFLAQGSVLKSQLNQASKQVTTIVYNAIQILTNQYEQFVQFVFEQAIPKNQLKVSQQFGQKEFENVQNMNELIKSYTNKAEQNIDNDDDFADISGKKQMLQIDDQLQQQNQPQQNVSQQKQEQQSQQQDWQDCVIIDSGYPQLTRNEQDQLLKKIISTTKISHNDYYKCQILDRMFLLFQEPLPIEQTPVSYFNKIMLQFVYQKPQQIMRYFYCDDKANGNNANKSVNGKNKTNITKDKKKGNTSNKLILSTSTTNKPAPRIRLLARHLYNNSVIELLVHLMELQADGNFFCPQKTQILKSITQQVFSPSLSNKEQAKKSEQSQVIMQTSTMWDLVEDRISNFVLFIKLLYEKLEDRYEQEKYLSVFKYFLNEKSIIRRIVTYFKQQHNYFDINGLVAILTLILRFDHANFIKHKSQQQKSNPFGGVDHFGFGNVSSSQKQDSSIASYDLRLSSQVLDQIQTILSVLIKKYREHEGSTMRMIEYYQLLYNWLNVTVASPKHEEFNKTQLLTVGFINDCLFKFQQHQRSSILHNAIKNILADFLPKFNDSIKIILAPQCELVAFIQNYLHIDDSVNQNLHNNNQKKKQLKKRKPKCFQNQLFHIGKAVLSVWQQQKMLSVIRKTQQLDDYYKQQHQQEQDALENPNYSDTPQSPTSDSENLIRFQKLRQIIAKKEEFYNHLICGDPKKMGEYQEQQSSEIIMTSSSSLLKNFFKPNLFNNDGGVMNDENANNQNGEGLLSGNNNNPSNKTTQKHNQSRDRYAAENQEEQQENKESEEEKKKKKQVITNKRRLEIQDLKRETNLKTDPKYKSLRIGQDDHTRSLFQSAISPLNANRSHTFNFQMDALPLDSDNSQQEAMSQEEDFPLRKESGQDDEMKLMQQNIENFDMVGGNFVLGMESNILSSNNSISHERSISNTNTNPLLLSTDNYRRQQLSKSVDMPQLNIDTIERVQSYLAIQSPRKQSQDEILSLGMDSKNSGSKMSEEKMSEEQLGSRLEVVTSQIAGVPSFMKDEQKDDEQSNFIGVNSKMQRETTGDEKTESNFVRHYSSYLSYNIDDLCMDLE